MLSVKYVIKSATSQRFFPEAAASELHDICFVENKGGTRWEEEHHPLESISPGHKEKGVSLARLLLQ